jgi:hypothetical protein
VVLDHADAGRERGTDERGSVKAKKTARAHENPRTLTLAHFQRLRLGRVDSEAMNIAGTLWTAKALLISDSTPRREKKRMQAKELFAVAWANRLDEAKQQILKAVNTGDSDFLRKLADAIELRSSGGLDRPNAYWTLSVWEGWFETHSTPPTAGELRSRILELKCVKEIAERTVCDICQRQGLALSPSKTGRPRKTRK